MLFPDPRFRSPTVVPLTMKFPWVMHLELEPHRTEQRTFGNPRSIKRIAAMGECEMDDLLILNIQGHRLELPLVYLSRLFPQALELDAPVLVERDEHIDIWTSSAARVLVVLTGVKQ